MSLAHEYAQSLASLTGTDFQEEICARLQSVNLGFQTIPAKPQGDGGLDGLSDDCKRGYCCYGPEHDEFKTNRSRETGIVEKFTEDLRRLFELERKSKKLLKKENKALATILPKGRKLQHVHLIVNWFESHRVLGRILTAVDEYREVSDCRFISKDVSVVVVGPKELANQHAVDEQTIIRSRQRVAIRRVKTAAETIELATSGDFEEKMAALLAMKPHQATAIRHLAEQLRTHWRTALAFDQELDETLPRFHEALEEHRSRILTHAVQLMLTDADPGSQLIESTKFAKQLLQEDFGEHYGSLIHDVGAGEIARLIGECPLGWEQPEGLDG